jgi:hypothetical protein
MMNSASTLVRTLLACICLLLFLATAPAQPSDRAVMINWQGINYAGKIIGSEGARFHVRYDEHREGRPDEEWVTADRLKNRDYTAFRLPTNRDETGAAHEPSNTAPSSTGNPMPTAIPTGQYVCSIFISGTGLVNNGEFTLFANGNYERGGTRGRYKYDKATGRVTFDGGVMDGRAAQYEARKLPTLQLKGNSGKVLATGEERTVASCERQ